MSQVTMLTVSSDHHRLQTFLALTVRRGLAAGMNTEILISFFGEQDYTVICIHNEGWDHKT